MKDIGFVIMQIGDNELDELYEKHIAPAISSAGFEPKRVDKHNDGELLKPKIVEFITEASVIVADLTNERPNCYLEVGYAMGLGKHRNLILTAREDHYPESPNHKSGGKRIHFDLNGYDILFWSPEKKEEFGVELLKRIKRRTFITRPSREVVVDQGWIEDSKKKALAGIAKQELTGYMNVVSTLRGDYSFNQIALRDAAREAPIHTFGWPIGAFLENNEEFKPKPANDGIVAEIPTPESSWGKTYDYWTLKSDGSFFLLHSLFEDTRGEKLLFFDVRINRITEAFLYLARLYNQLKVDTATPVHIVIEHSDLNGRTLKAAGNRLMLANRVGTVEGARTELDTTVGELESKLMDHVETVAKELFVGFDYFSLERKIIEDIVTNFVNGKIS